MNKIYTKAMFFFMFLFPVLAFAQFDEEGAELAKDYGAWNHFSQTIALIFGVIALLVVLYYIIRLATAKGSKDKYDFINMHEVKALWIAVVFIIIGSCFYANSFITELTSVLIGVRIFVSVAMSLMIAVVIQTLLRFYYPFYIEKRLKTLRYQPRISPKTGKPMKLLSEEEEDAYLDEGMQAEENVFSVDYDVWKDEETGYIQIEKYSGLFHAIQCPECNYQTFKIVKEEVTKQPTEIEEGEVIKHYQCSYCNYKSKKSAALKRQNKIEQAATSN